jgi:hypothetical protein
MRYFWLSGVYPRPSRYHALSEGELTEELGTARRVEVRQPHNAGYPLRGSRFLASKSQTQ